MHPLIVNLWKATGTAFPIVEKVWGTETWIENSDNYCLKLLEIKPGFRCSLHRHLKKEETFWVVSGTVELEQQIPFAKGISLRILVPQSKITLFPRTWHRFGSIGGALIFEISTHHDDADVERLLPSGPIPANEEGM